MSHTAFATLHGENQDGERPCLCGSKHGEENRWENCEYITPECRSSGWKGKPETFEKINKVINKWGRAKRKWFVKKFKYDGLQEKSSEEKNAKKASKQRKSKNLKDSELEDNSEDNSSTTAACLITYSAFGLLKDYRLYNS